MGCSIPDVIEYDGSRKLCTEGIIVDENGYPIPNIAIKLIAYSSEECAVLNTAMTDQFGRFNTCFSDIDRTFYMININAASIIYGPCGSYFNNSSELYNPKYGSINYFVDITGEEDLTFILDGNDAIIGAPAILNLEVLDSSSYDSYFGVEYDGDANSDIISAFKNSLYGNYIRQGNYTLNLKANTTMTFYHLNNQSLIDTFTTYLKEGMNNYTLDFN